MAISSVQFFHGCKPPSICNANIIAANNVTAAALSFPRTPPFLPPTKRNLLRNFSCGRASFGGRSRNLAAALPADRGGETADKQVQQASSTDPVIKLGPWGRDLKKENFSFQFPNAERIKAIIVTGSAVLHSIVFIVEDSNGNEETIKFGGPGGTANPKVEFTSGEYLKTIAGAYGTWSNYVYVTSLTFITNKRTYGPYGNEEDRPSGATGVVKFSFPMESYIAGFYGYADDHINCIGVYARPAGTDPFIKIGPWGRVAEDNWKFLLPTERHITDITLSNGTVVDSLTFLIKQGNGEEETLKFGGHGGYNHYKVGMGSGEYLTTITGAYADWTEVGVYVVSLTFVTNVHKKGPYGLEEDWKDWPTTGTVKFSLPMENAEIVGFFGYCDKYLQNIGVYARPRPRPL